MVPYNSLPTTWKVESYRWTKIPWTCYIPNILTTKTHQKMLCYKAQNTLSTRFSSMLSMKTWYSELHSWRDEVPVRLVLMLMGGDVSDIERLWRLRYRFTKHTRQNDQIDLRRGSQWQLFRCTTRFKIGALK